MKRLLPIIIFLFVLGCISPISRTFSNNHFNKYLGNPVIPVGTSGSWEDEHLGLASVIFDGDLYKAWYSGRQNGRWSIGYATSVDGVSWTKYSVNPVLSWTGNVNEPNNYHTPVVIFDSGLFKMWYTSSVNDVSNFNIGYATSTDGIIWTRINYSVIPLIQPWAISGVVTPGVIKVGALYKIWYSSSSSGSWKIGYATSPDGISWTPYPGNPVLQQSQPWEHAQTLSPSVIFDGTTYHMYYNTNHFGNPSNLSYAYSTDGINWTKPPELNPVLTIGNIGDFDSNGIGYASALKIGSTTVLYYGGANPATTQIGIASDGPFPIPSASPTPSPDHTPTPTATPSPSPSLTPTSTPTPTPTPTPASLPVTKVVFIPGMAGSYNMDAVENCLSDNYQGVWTSWYFGDQVYSSLLSAFSASGISPLPFYYDWRKDPRESALLLKNFINSQTNPLEKVHVVGHSLGGLVARAYIEQEEAGNKIDTLVTVGTPHDGSVNAYPAWSAGQIWGDPRWTLFATYIKIRCHLQGIENDKDIIRTYIPSVQSVLPTFDFLQRRNPTQMVPFASMFARNNWLPTSFAPPSWGVNIHTIAGRGFPTASILPIVNRNTIDELLGYWEDGKPTRRINTLAGDDTVLTESALLAGSQQEVIRKNHIQLVSSRVGIQTILSHLPLSQPLNSLRITETKSTNSFIGIYSDNVNVSLLTTETADTSTTLGRLMIIPIERKRLFKLRLTPFGQKSDIYIIQALANGEATWKKYALSGAQSSLKYLFANPTSLVIDPLQ